VTIDYCYVTSPYLYYLATAELTAVMDQLFRQMTLSQCRQNASAATRSSETNFSVSAGDNRTCQEAADEMLELRYAMIH